MSAFQPYWHLLIRAWLSRGRYGLTIPFLVGARTVTSGGTSASREDIAALLSEIIERPVAGHIVFARWCDDIDSVVLASYAEDFPYRPRHNLVEFRPANGETISFAVEKDVAIRLGVRAIANEVLNALIEYAAPTVTRGHFSRYWTDDGRNNGPLQPDDLQFIQESLGKNAA